MTTSHHQVDDAVEEATLDDEADDDAPRPALPTAASASSIAEPEQL